MIPLSGSGDPQAHQDTIRAMFNRIARRYDLMNDLMSGGVHRFWKRRLVALAGEPPVPGAKAVDLAGGTGDVARLLEARGWDVTVCDPSDGMMEVGRARASGRFRGLGRDLAAAFRRLRSRGPARSGSAWIELGAALRDSLFRKRNASGIAWVSGVAEALPFADASVDLVTISFGLRNTADREAALAEVQRILRPGGRFLCLEFSRPHVLIRASYDLYSSTVIPELARVFSNDPEAYTYLIRSIRAFPDQEGLRLMMLQAGFAEVEFRNLFFGIAALHSGLRPVSGLTKEPAP